MKLFASNNIEVYFQSGSQPFALIAFSPLNYAPGLNFWAKGLAKKLDVTIIGVAANRGNWFPARDMHAAAPAIRKALSQFSDVLAYGASMGGYAALKYGALLGASHTLAFAPQHSIDPSLVGFEHRFIRYFSPDLNEDMSISEGDVCRNAVILSDPFLRLDQMHVDLIKANVPRVKSFQIPNGGHSVIELFAGTETMNTLFDLCLRRDDAKMNTLIKRLLRGSFIGKRTIIEKLIDKKKVDLARRAFTKHRSNYTDRQAAMVMNSLSREYLGRGSVQEAKELIEVALQLAPTEPALMIRASQIASRQCDFKEEIRWLKLAITNTPNEIHHRLLLAEACVRDGDGAQAMQVLEEIISVDPANAAANILLRSLSQPHPAKSLPAV